MALFKKLASRTRPGSSQQKLVELMHVMTTAENDVASNTETGSEVQPLSAMDGPFPWPVIGNFLAYIKKENRGRLHELQARQHKQYGAIFKEKLGPMTHVHICDPDVIAQVFRNHGRFPIRRPFDSWVEHRKVSGEKLGILTAQGEEWWQIRRVLSQKMLKPKMVSEFEGELNNVLVDAVDRLRRLRDTEGDEQLVTALPNELYKWAFESIGTILFETRMGCLQDHMPERTQEFINAIAQMMTSSLELMIGETIHRRLNTRFWRRHKEAWDKLFELAKSYVDSRLEILRPRLESGDMEDEKGEFLTYLLSSKKFSMSDIYSNITEVMLGGIDTTSNTLCFALYMLAQHPEVQQRLHSEVTDLIGNRAATADDVKQMTYLKYIVKETLRLYPVVTMNVRMLDEDMDLEGYRIPKDTLFVLNHYAACRDERLFERASEFIPERWNRDEEHNIHPFAALPFGYGTRSCVGRRVAELELYLALARLSQTFEILPYEGIEFQPQLRTVLTPGTGVPVRLVDR